MKVCIERKNTQVTNNTIPLKISTLLTLETLKWETYVFIKLGSLLSVTCRHRSVQIWNSTLIVQVYCESLQMDSEGRIIEVVLGSEFSDYDRRTTITKLGLKTGAGSSHGKSVLAPIRFIILHSVYDSLGRLATAALSYPFSNAN